MLGRFTDYCKTKVQSVYTGTRDVFYHSPVYGFLNSFVFDFTIKGWEGFTRIADPSNVTKIMQSPKTREVFATSFKANVIYYLGVAIVLEKFSQSLSDYFAEEQEDNAALALVINSLNIFMLLKLGSITLHRYYENTMLNITLTERIVAENPISSHFPACECSGSKKISAVLFSPLNLSTKLALIKIISYVPGLRHVAPLSYMYIYGESLMESLYAAVKMCSRHRAKELAKNKAYLLGLGGSLYALCGLTSFLIARQLGVSSFFIDDAVYSMLYPCFVSATLLQDRQIPGDQTGIEVFYYQRILLQKMTFDVRDLISEQLRSDKPFESWKLPKLSFSPEDYFVLRRMKQVFNFLWWWLANDGYASWYTLKGFVTDPANMLFSAEYFQMVKDKVDFAIYMRAPLHTKPLAEIPLAAVAPLVPHLPDWMTQWMVSKEFKEGIRLVFSDAMKDPLALFRKILVNIDHMQEETLQKTKMLVGKQEWKTIQQQLVISDKDMKPKQDAALATIQTAAQARPVSLMLATQSVFAEQQQTANRRININYIEDYDPSKIQKALR